MNPRLVACLLVSILLLCPACPGRTAHAAQDASAPAQPAAPAADPPASFHGIAWGTPLADIKDMTVVETHGPASYAKVAGLEPRIAEVEVSDIVYAFCNDRFAGAMAVFRGRDRLDAVRGVVAGRYGQPVAPEAAGQNVGWPLGDVLIMLEFDATLGVGELSYLHAPTYAPCTEPAEQTPPSETPSESRPGTEARP